MKSLKVISDNRNRLLKKIKKSLRQYIKSFDKNFNQVSEKFLSFKYVDNKFIFTLKDKYFTIEYIFDKNDNLKYTFQNNISGFYQDWMITDNWHITNYYTASFFHYEHN